MRGVDRVGVRRRGVLLVSEDMGLWHFSVARVRPGPDTRDRPTHAPGSKDCLDGEPGAEGVSTLSHGDRMKRANHCAIATARAPIRILKRRRLLPLLDFEAEKVKAARGDAPTAARATRGVDSGQPTGSVRAARRVCVHL